MLIHWKAQWNCKYLARFIKNKTEETIININNEIGIIVIDHIDIINIIKEYYGQIYDNKFDYVDE